VRSPAISTHKIATMNAPARNQGQFKRNTRGIGLTYSNVEQQLKNNNAFYRRVEQNESQLAFVLPTKQQIAHALLNLKDNDPQHIIVCQETHQDGACHFHVYIQWLAPHSNVDERYFDIYGMHPNIIQVRNQEDWVAYIQKQDTVPFTWVPIFFLGDSDDEGYSQSG